MKNVDAQTRSRFFVFFTVVINAGPRSVFALLILIGRNSLSKLTVRKLSDTDGLCQFSLGCERYSETSQSNNLLTSDVCVHA